MDEADVKQASSMGIRCTVLINGTLFSPEAVTEHRQKIIEIACLPAKDPNWFRMLPALGEATCATFDSFTPVDSKISAFLSEVDDAPLSYDGWRYAGIHVSNPSIDNATVRELPCLYIYPKNGALVLHVAEHKENSVTGGGNFETIRVDHFPLQDFDKAGIEDSHALSQKPTEHTFTVMKEITVNPLVQEEPFIYLPDTEKEVMLGSAKSGILLHLNLQKAVHAQNGQPLAYKRGLVWCIRKFAVFMAP